MAITAPNRRNTGKNLHLRFIDIEVAHPHHPEHSPNGVNDMNLIDLMEMLCDWYVAAPDIDQSIHENSRDYKIDPHITQILKNTARKLKEIASIEEE